MQSIPIVRLLIKRVLPCRQVISQKEFTLYSSQSFGPPRAFLVDPFIAKARPVSENKDTFALHQIL